MRSSRLIESDLNSVFSSKLVLVLGADKRIKDCSFAFSKRFGTVAAGTNFDALFDPRGKDIFTRHLALQPFRCIWRATGQEICGLLTGGCDGYSLVFEECESLATGKSLGIKDYRFFMLIDNMKEGVAFHQLIYAL